MAALAALRYNDVIKAFADRLKERGNNGWKSRGSHA